MQMQISIKGNPANNVYPSCKILINNIELYNDFVIDKKDIELSFDAQEINTLNIIHYDKKSTDTVVENGTIVEDKSLELIAVKIEHLNILEVNLYNCPFYVDWPIYKIREYAKQGTQPPQYLKQSLYFGYNGNYELKFFGNLDKEYFNQFWLNECQSNEMQTLDNDLFNQFGNLVDINAKFSLSIYDLEKML